LRKDSASRAEYKTSLLVFDAKTRPIFVFFANILKKAKTAAKDSFLTKKTLFVSIPVIYFLQLKTE